MHKTHTGLPATPMPIWCYRFPSDFTLSSFHKNSQDAAPPDLLPQANFFFFGRITMKLLSAVLPAISPQALWRFPGRFCSVVVFRKASVPLQCSCECSRSLTECGEMHTRHNPPGGAGDYLVGGAWDPILEC